MGHLGAIIAGEDLNRAYPALNFQEKSSVLQEVLRAQQIVQQKLPRGNGFGYTGAPLQPPHTSWRAVIFAELQKARRRIDRSRAVDAYHVDRVAQQLDHFDAYFKTILPI